MKEPVEYSKFFFKLKSKHENPGSQEAMKKNPEVLKILTWAT
jgi:hypothetical protein